MNFPVIRPQYFQAFPSYAFPGLSGEIIRDLERGGATPQLAGTVLIGIISLLTQGVADVFWPNAHKSVIGNSVCVVASSGFGKSVILNILKDPIERYLRRHCESDDKYLDFLMEDVTRPAIVESLVRLPVSGLVTEEAGQILELFRHSATLVKFLDGSSMRNSRVGSGRKAILNPRLLMLLMMQPVAFEAIKGKLIAKGGVGLANRLFFANCEGIVTNATPHNLCLSQEVEVAYEKKVTSLLDQTFQQLENPTCERPTLSLCTQAAEFLVRLSHDVLIRYQHGGSSSPISEYASRHAERVLRFSAALHVFEFGVEGEISLDTIQSAANLGSYYLDTFEQLTYQPYQPTQLQTDVASLFNALNNLLSAYGTSRFLISDLRSTFAINLGQTPSRLSRALAELAKQNKLTAFTEDKKRWVQFHPYNFSPY
ncbi:MAG: DUF3987 domain-containing protein [Burkholderiaceae bacterium]|nr:DUF3987 domain-containing protein [Burkholderiaceae bacterium]